ncbi:hypothetical protein VB711_16305 [Cronbergia sp. UHCC 0137]|uniref:hypothetical protein n=1 Tax=Cronbergia sp. UHCC 0137 TaxID=3110239 RepID=UPI002B1ECC9F|nr:hypothetical protein [Cronbergia sp. UHCC 0137]MEA5619392.1 hypothetical protein [Cronbergia sp. UHCC 0137]
MNFKLDHHTPEYLVSLFSLLIREGITPNQIMLGIVHLATENHELDGMIVSVDCFRFLLLAMPIDVNPNDHGLTKFISSLALEGVTTLMLLDALGYACYVCGLFDSANLIRLTYKRLQADAIISQMLSD